MNQISAKPTIRPIVLLFLTCSLQTIEKNLANGAPPQKTFPSFSYHKIDNQGIRLGQTSIADMDNDGDLDWVAGQAFHSGSKTWWWEYQGPDRWVQHYLGQGNTDVGGSVYDLNGDGWLDLFSGSKILLSTGRPRTERFKEYEIGATVSHDSEFADINGDGKMDAIANSDTTGLFWYEIPADPTQPWLAHTIATRDQHKIHGGVSPNAVGDMDGDGDNDVVTGQAWYENRDGQGLQWKQHMNIDFGEHHKYGLAVRTWIHDMDGDGDNDFVQAEADNPDARVAWFENDGQGHWTRHIIKDKGDGQDFHSLVVADFDNDGDMDVFSGGGPLSKSKKPICYIWENTAGPTGCPTSKHWQEHIIIHKPCHEAVGADVDGDGDIDLCSKPWSMGGEHFFLQNRLAQRKKKGFVTIATIGPSPLAVSADTEPQQVVRQVIAHWRGLFARVLPDWPDLIVVPEACDRPRGLSRDRLDAYFQVRQNQVRDFFSQVARENQCYLVYSAKRAMPDGTWRNSSMMIDRRGKVIGIYNKNHPTIGEIDSGILCGQAAPIIECDFGRVALAICFDPFIRLCEYDDT